MAFLLSLPHVQSIRKRKQESSFSALFLGHITCLYRYMRASAGSNHIAEYFLISLTATVINLSEMAACFPQRFSGYRSHVMASIALCFTGLFLLIPQVFNVFMYFSPLLLSTALFVTALLSLRSFISTSEPENDGTDYVKEDFPLEAEEEHVNTMSDRHVENTCFIQCVKELHENGILLVESMFKMEMFKQSNKEITEDNHQLNVEGVIETPKKESSTLETHEQ